jgi:dTDP-4-amino-4,6-dideoxygalactose transaminase
MKSKIWLSSPHMGGREQVYVNDAFDTNWVAPLGPHVDGFENEICTFTGAGAAAALSSGTAAVHLALILAGVKAGDEVLCSSFTFSASANPIVYCGAQPIFVDSERETWNIDPELLEKAILERIAMGKKIAAAVIVHLYGMPANMPVIAEVLSRYNIPLIEDAAESLGSTIHQKSTGTFGLFGILSFNGNKIITTSGGGALISDDKELIQKARFLATQARDTAPHYQHSQIGYNYRMSNVCAAIGRGQMEVLNDRIKSRRANYDFYRELFKSLPGVSFQPEPEGYYSNRWLTAILIDPVETGTSREALRLAMEAQNIEARPLWKPMHLQPIFQSAPAYINGNSEDFFNNGLCLPSGSNLTSEDRDRIREVVQQVFRTVLQ